MLLGSKALLAARLAAGLAAGAALFLGSCGDNPACVFGPTNCQGGGGGGGTPGALGTEAFLPEDGQWIREGSPTVTDVRPGNNASTTTPIVITFSESMAGPTLDGAVRIRVAGGGVGLPVLASASLVGDGRVLIFLPAVPLMAGTTYEIVLDEDAPLPTDLTGQTLVVSSDGLIDTFTIGTNDPDAPRVVATWPPDGASAQSATTEMVVVFDRIMQQATADEGSFLVEVGGVPPAFLPDPQPLALSVGPLPITDTRVYTLRSEDDEGVPAPLGAGETVLVTLSPTGDPIEALDGEELPTTTFEYDVAPFSAPVTATIVSMPTEAIGIENLDADGTNDLAIEVELANGQPGDRVGVFLFGQGLGEDDGIVALFRQVTIEGTAPITTVTLDAGDIDLGTTGPVAGRFQDGFVAFALRVRRGTQVSPVTVLDVEPETPGIQDPLLDTERPVLMALTNPGADGQLFRSDQRDLVVTGRASEPLRAVDVVTPLGSNVPPGETATVVGSNAEGFFVAAPVDLGGVVGALDLPLDYELVLYDRALNTNKGGPVVGQFTQLGAVGPEMLVDDGSIAVQVFDAVTLAPILGAAVMTHSDDVGFPLVSSAASDADGSAAVTAASTGLATILSVGAPGYDLFTFHGVTAGRVGVPLAPTAPSASGPASAVGAVTTTDPFAQFVLPQIDLRFADSRRLESALPSVPGGNCGVDPMTGQLSCPVGPIDVRPGLVGAQTAIGGLFAPSSLGAFSPALAVQSFSFELPVRPRNTGQETATLFDVPFLLTAPGVPDAETTKEVAPEQTLRLVGDLTEGIDFGTDPAGVENLVGDPAFTGKPIVTVEAVVPGLAAPALVGVGNGFLTPGTRTWTIRAAFAGAASGEGSLGDAIEPDLLLRAEIRDMAGNRAGQRPRISTLAQLPLPLTMFAGNVPELFTPAPGGTTGGDSYTIEFDNSLLDVQTGPQGGAGLYRLTLTASDGRRWVLWRVDPPGGTGPVQVRVPDVALGGAVPLVDGPLELRIATFAWPTLDPAAFLWSDVEREYDVFSFSAPLMFTQD